MDRNALDWIFSTAPQAIAALVGLIYTGTSFIYDKLESKIKNDSTLDSIIDSFKKRMYKSLQYIIFLSGFSIIVDLCFIFCNPISNDIIFSFSGTFCPYFCSVIIFLLINIITVFWAFRFIFIIMNPDFINKTVKKLSLKYSKEQTDYGKNVSKNDFLNEFIIFENKARELCLLAIDRKIGRLDQIYPYNKSANNYLSIRSIVNYLQKFNIISIDKDYIFEAINVRNLIVHGNEINRVQKELYDYIQKLTDEIDKKIKEINNELIN